MKACPEDAVNVSMGQAWLVWLMAGLALASGAVGLLWIDQSLPHAGLWLLISFSVTVGFAHGALDVWLLLVRFQPFVHATRLGLAYLLLVLLLGGLLSFAVPVALLLLILTSLWHFGEDYARWSAMPAKARLLTRLVVGGAPVMAPLLIKPAGMAALFSLWPVLADAVPVWQFMAWFWLALVIVWAIRWGWQHRQASRFVWLELGAVLLLNLAFSPLMAFALYFGLYHAPVHIWRVWRLWRVWHSQKPGGKSAIASNAASNAVRSLGSTSALAVLAAMVSISLVLGSGLWWLLSQQLNYLIFPTDLGAALAMALPWLIVALAAVTLPHLILISCCTAWLSGNSKPSRANTID